MLGWWMSHMPEAAQGTCEVWVSVVRDIFLHLIKAMIAPLIFASVVQGIAGTGDLKKVGRIGLKAFIYFELVTTAALVVGLLAANLVKPGSGVTAVASAPASTTPLAKALTADETVLHTFPTSLVDAMARNDVLQIVCFAVLFAVAVSAAGQAGEPVLEFCGSLTQVMFKFAGIIMRFAPFGVGAAIAVTVCHQGLGSLRILGTLVLTLYGTLVVFMVVVFGTVIRIAKVPLKPFIRAVREPFILALVLGIIVSAGLYFAYVWERLEKRKRWPNFSSPPRSL